jgi:hypothetical protein
MSRVDKLIQSYKTYISLTWEDNLAGNQRIIFAVYDKVDERTLRTKLTEFELCTQQANHSWYHHDLTDAFPDWMAQEDYKESYFQSPEDLEMLMPEFRAHLTQQMVERLTAETVDTNTVVALSGLSGLFGFLKISDLVAQLQPQVRGRLLLFFPGDYENKNYRFLDARDGWNYLAVPITA